MYRETPCSGAGFDTALVPRLAFPFSVFCGTARQRVPNRTCSVPCRFTRQGREQRPFFVLSVYRAVLRGTDTERLDGMEVGTGITHQLVVPNRYCVCTAYAVRSTVRAVMRYIFAAKRIGSIKTGIGDSLSVAFKEALPCCESDVAHARVSRV